MAQFAQLPDGNYVEFPDEWSEEQMDAAVYRDFADQFPDREGPGVLDTAAAKSKEILSSLGEQVSPAPDAEFIGPQPEADTFLGAIGKHIQNLPAVGKMTAGGLMQTAEEPFPLTAGAMASQAEGEEMSMFDKLGMAMKMAASGEMHSLLREPFVGGPDSEIQEVRDVSAEKGAEWAAEGAAEYAANQPQGLTGAAKLGSDTARAVLEMAPAYTLAFLTRNPAMVPAVMGTQVKGRSYAESRAQDLAPYEASARSNFNVFAEGLPEYIPALAILKRGGALSKLGWGALGEGAQEMVTEVLHETYDKRELEGMSLKDAIADIDWGKVLYSGAVGVGAGGAMATGVAGAEAVGEEIALRKQERGYEKRVDEALADIADAQAKAALSPDSGVAPERTARRAEDVGPPAAGATARAEEVSQAQEAYTTAEAAEAAEKLGGKASGAQQLTEEEARVEETRILAEREQFAQEQRQAGETEAAYAQRRAAEEEQKTADLAEAKVQQAKQETLDQNKKEEALRIAEAKSRVVDEQPTSMEQAFQKAVDEELVAELREALPPKEVEPVTPVEEKPAAAPVKLTHYSTVADLTEIDPVRHGEGVSGQESKRKKADPADWVDRSYFYMGEKPGHKDAMLGSEKYEIEFDPNKLYDFKADPDGLKAQATEASPYAPDTLNLSKYEKAVRAAGYSGYWTDTAEQGKVVAMFEKTPTAPVAAEPVAAEPVAAEPVAAEGEGRRAQTTEVTEDKRTGVDRRKDTAAREKIAGMSREELENHVLNHELTGVKGRFSFEAEQEGMTFMASLDADSLKAVNDNMSPGSGDTLLQNVATALINEFGYDRVYHISGDEYYVASFGQGEENLIKEGVARANERLADATINVRKPDGTEVTLTGIAATPGYGATREEADYALKQEKQAREARGERASRGDLPAGLVISPAPGKPGTEGQATPDEGVAGEKQDGPGTKGGTLYSNPIGEAARIWEDMADKAIGVWNDAVGWRYDALGKLPSKQLYLTERYKVLGRIADVDKIAKDVYSTFRNASQEDQRAVYDYLTTPDATPNIVADAAVRKKAIATKKLINKTGQALVDRGLLAEEAFLKNKDGYLPRTYLKYLIGDDVVRQITGGKKVSKMGWSKARQDIPAEVRELILGEITDPAYLASKGLGTELRDIAIIDFLDFISQTEDWVHDDTTVEWQDRTVSVIWLDQEASRLEKQAAYYTEGARAKTLAIVADMRSLLEGTAAPGEKPVDSKDYRQVPVNKRYGRLQGMYVRKEIYEDLLSTGQIMPGDADFWENWFGYGGKGTKVTQLWKMSKVAMNPPAQIRNAASNMILLHLSGMPLPMVPVYIAKAAKQIRTDGRYWRMAKKHGVTESTFAAQELFRIERDLLDLESRLSGPLSIATMKNMAGIIGEAAGDAYQLIEALGKTAKIMHAMEAQNMSADDATMEAQKWLFDYSLVPPAVRTARNMPLGIPFITFYYKVLPRLLETAIKRPWAYAPYVALPQVMAMLFAEMNDVDDEDAKQLMKSFPMWLQERGNAFLYPFKDAAGRWQAVDFGYILPWSMFVESGRKAAKGDFADSVKATGVFGGPIPSIVNAIKTNTDPYTGREVVPAGANPKDQVMGMLTYVYNLAMPTWTTSQGFAGKMLDAINEDVETNEEMGRTVLTPGQAALRMVGANVYPFDPERSRGKNIEHMQKKMQEIKTHSRRKIMDVVNNKDGNEQEIEAIIDDTAKRMQTIATKIEEYAEGSEVPEALTLD